MTIISNSIYLLFLILAIIASRLVGKLSKAHNLSEVNKPLIDSFPAIFTTLGLLGTFIGIFMGLQSFDVNNIDDSIPNLLYGLKTSFLTSIVGIILSLIFSQYINYAKRKFESSQPIKSTRELDALNLMVESIINFEKSNTSLFEQAISKITTKIENFDRKVLNQLKDNKLDKNPLILEVSDRLLKISNAINSNKEGDLFFLLKNQENLLKSNNTTLASNHKDLLETLIKNEKSLNIKFEEFNKLLADNNSKALVAVMQDATEKFNDQMTKIVERLVQENFKELNNSVKNMINWQSENKDMIAKLTNQFENVTQDLSSSSASIKEITLNTKSLTDENSNLSILIKELRGAMVDDTQFKQLIIKLSNTVEHLEKSSEVMNNSTDQLVETTENLKKWILSERHFKESVDILLTRLDEYEKIIKYNGDFWNGTKKQMEEGISLIANASGQIRTQINSMNEVFYRELNDTLTSLDNLIQRYINR